MKIIIAKRAGFCFGVKRAIDMAFEAAETKKGHVRTLGPIIHNPQVIEQLSSRGVKPVDTIEDNIEVMLIRTHGIPAPLYDELQNKGIEVLDATCPFVKKAQQYAKLLKDEGYQVIILGDKDHPEVKGILSYAGEDAIVVKDVSEIDKISKKVGIVVQTTQPVDALKKLISRVIETAKEVKVYNTICNSTALRLKETEELAKETDVMLVIGGKNSANTKQLARLCESIGVQTHHIETAEELEPEWFSAAETVGITAGASTPDWIITEVVERLRTIK